MESRHAKVGNGVTVRVFEDGDVVVSHDTASDYVNLGDVSGYGLLLGLCDDLGLNADVEGEVIDFVQDNTGLFA